MLPLATYDPFAKIFCNLEDCESDCRNVGEEEMSIQEKDKEIRLLSAEQEGRENIVRVGEADQEENMEMEEGILTTQEGEEGEGEQSQGKNCHQTDGDMGGQGTLDKWPRLILGSEDKSGMGKQMEGGRRWITRGGRNCIGGRGKWTIGG